MITRAFISLVALAHFGGCGGGAAQSTGGASLPSNGLIARFEPPSSAIATTTDARLTYILENRGPAAATIDLDMLGSAIFSLDVFDARGTRINTIPPGVPPANYRARTAPLAPGGQRRFTLDLNVFSPPLPAGTYTAKIRGTNIHSETLHFDVSP